MYKYATFLSTSHQRNHHKGLLHWLHFVDALFLETRLA